jgi:hypothetical protein
MNSWINLQQYSCCYGNLQTTFKSPLKESPFIKYLYIDVNNEGSWNSNYMSLQFEDVVNCLQALHPHFNMLKAYGGAQPIMRDTTIMAEEGFLGLNLPALKAGDIQSMVFKATDGGPCRVLVAWAAGITASDTIEHQGQAAWWWFDQSNCLSMH